MGSWQERGEDGTQMAVEWLKFIAEPGRRVLSGPLTYCVHSVAHGSPRAMRHFQGANVKQKVAPRSNAASATQTRPP